MAWPIVELMVSVKVRVSEACLMKLGREAMLSVRLGVSVMVLT